MTTEIALPLPRRYRFSIREYEALGIHGILGTDAHVELIDGEIIEMSPIGWKHVRIVNNLTGLLGQALGKDAIVSIQNPIVLSEHSEPQPDVAVLRLSAAQHIGNAVEADVWFVVEVADATLSYDDRVKLPLYARAGIEEVWIIDVDGEVISQYSQPMDDRYAVITALTRKDTIVSHVLPDLRLSIDDILP